MERKRSGLVPIGDVAVRLPGIEGRGRAMSARARQHFTLLKQVKQLIEAAEGEPEIGFMARLLALCSLPRTNPRDRLQYVRRNGPYTLVMIAGGRTGCHSVISRVYFSRGSALRRCGRNRAIWSWVGRCMSSCTSSAWRIRSGGLHGERARLKNQMDRLFTSSVQLVYAAADHKVVVSSFVAERAEFWWNTKRPEAPVLWDSTIQLGERFFQEIIAHPIPLDMHTLRALKRSPLGLDLYFWLVYKTFALHQPLTLSWRQLYRQFGASQAHGGPVYINSFRRSVLREFKKIKRVWPGLGYRTVTGGLVIEPSPPRIPPSQLHLISE